MTKGPSPGDAGFGQIAQLFELSLSIGTSLDLLTSCERFLSVLMARKNLAFAAVWIRDSLLPGGQADTGEEDQPYDQRLVWGSPQVHIRERTLSSQHPLSLQAGTGPCSVGSDEAQWNDLIAEAPVGPGRCAVFPLGNLGLLKLVSLTSSAPYSAPEVGQLDTLIRKFALSLEACLAHERAIADRRDRDRLAAILENTGDFVGIADTDFNITYVNKPGLRMIGLPEDENISGSPLGCLHPPEVGERIARVAIPHAMTHGIWQGETRLLTASGKEIVGLQTVLHHRDGDEHYFSTTIRDITERVRLEEQLRQAQKLEAVGQLAAGVAHDFNNLLTAILGHADLLRRQISGRPMETEGLEAISTASKRAADLTEQLLAFSRRQPVSKIAFKVDDLVHDVIALLSRTFDPNITIESDLNTADWTTEGDRSQLQNVLINLAVNARDAMPEGGCIKFLTRAIEHESDQTLEIQVSDTGIGMDESTVSRIFEPFFTTKGPGGGTGLGLAVAYGTIQAHGGEITVESEIGSGTTFSISLPAAEGDDAVLALGEDVQEEAILGVGKILVVDDLESVRDVTGAMLESLGYEVDKAKDGFEAVDKVSNNGGELCAVVLDLMMPGLDGAETLRRLRSIAPQLPVLMISGFGHERLLTKVSDIGVEGFLRKPFSLVQLSAKLANVLNDT